MVVTANDMRDLHIHVVDHDGQIVGRRAVGAANDQIIQLFVVEVDTAADQIVYLNHAAVGIAKTDHMGLVGINIAMPAVAVVARLHFALHGGLAQLIQPLSGTVAAVGKAPGEQVVDHFVIAIETLGLVKGPFVVLQTEPGHALQDRVDRFRCGAFQIGILDTQHEFTTVLTGIEPGKERGTGTTDMQISGGTWGKTGTDCH